MELLVRLEPGLVTNYLVTSTGCGKIKKNIYIEIVLSVLEVLTTTTKMVMLTFITKGTTPA